MENQIKNPKTLTPQKISNTEQKSDFTIKNDEKMSKNRAYYEKNKERIISNNKIRLSKKSIEEKEKIKQYHKDYYNKIRKKSKNWKDKNLESKLFKKSTNISNISNIKDPDIKIEFGVFILDV
jgi:hypothetical protein